MKYTKVRLWKNWFEIASNVSACCQFTWNWSEPNLGGLQVVVERVQNRGLARVWSALDRRGRPPLSYITPSWVTTRGQRVTRNQTRIGFFPRDSVLGLGFLLKHRVWVISESLKNCTLFFIFFYKKNAQTDSGQNLSIAFINGHCIIFLKLDFQGFGAILVDFAWILKLPN